MQVSRNLPGWSKFITPFMYHKDDILAKWGLLFIKD
jgi:hypothetical protein